MNIDSKLRELLYYMREMDTEEVSVKAGNRVLTALLTEAEENANIETGRECAKSIPPEEGARAGDSIIPAFLGAAPSYSFFVEWQTKSGLWHTNMLEDVDEHMIQCMPENPKIQYDTHTNTLTIRR